MFTFFGRRHWFFKPRQTASAWHDDQADCCTAFGMELSFDHTQAPLPEPQPPVEATMAGPPRAVGWLGLWFAGRKPAA